MLNVWILQHAERDISTSYTTRKAPDNVLVKLVDERCLHYLGLLRRGSG